MQDELWDTLTPLDAALYAIISDAHQLVAIVEINPTSATIAEGKALCVSIAGKLDALKI
jgi:hypothetical protein